MTAHAAGHSVDAVLLSALRVPPRGRRKAEIRIDEVEGSDYRRRLKAHGGNRVTVPFFRHRFVTRRAASAKVRRGPDNRYVLSTGLKL